MAKKKEKTSKNIDNEGGEKIKNFAKKAKSSITLSESNPRTRRVVKGVILSGIALVLSLAGVHKAGVAGEKLFVVLTYLIGIGYFLLPLLLLVLAISYLVQKAPKDFEGHRILGSILFLISSLSLIHLSFPMQGGIVGEKIGGTMNSLLDLYASIIISGAFLIASIFIIFELKDVEETDEKTISKISVFERIKLKLFGEEKTKQADEKISEIADKAIEALPAENIKTEEKEVEEKPVKVKVKETPDNEKIEAVENSGISLPPISGEPFPLPPVSLLEGDRGKPGVGDIKANANIIKRTLQNFGIAVEMDEITIGPTVTRYALKPAEGVKLSRIVTLQDDLSYALAAHPIRIEAPIPGKSLVGIEVPNSVKSIVGLGTMFSTQEFTNSHKPLLVSLGRGLSGEPHYANLAKMPHLLIAGATGSGKSVTIHAIIASLLYRNSPENLRFIMVDPKRVELTLYNKIPHLLTPVITDAKKTILALKWAAKEMDRRYDILESESVRDIESYHKNVLAPALEKIRKGEIAETESSQLPETMPYICIVIDELADIMQTYPRELEASIVRLAQMSRAVGIHLILSTQRPSVNVITGLIKANVPARIALQVASQIDSRTILDMGGAEKLLGAGDMLYLSGDMPQPQRIQSPFISETELKKVVKYLISAGESIPPSEINLTQKEVESGGFFASSIEDEDDGEADDDLYEEAREIVMKAGKASTSYLQRRLRVGYARAARIMDILEEKGVIGPADGAKPREVLEKGDGYGEETSDENEDDFKSTETV